MPGELHSGETCLNLFFFNPEFPEVFASAASAETQALNDPRAAAVHTRIALEGMVDWLYRRVASLKSPYQPGLAAGLAEPTFQALLGPTLTLKAQFVRQVGNAGAHGKPVSSAQAGGALREFFHLAYWLAHNYAKGPKPPPEAAFKLEDLPRLAAVPAKSLATLQEIARRFEETVRARDAAEAAQRASEDGRAALEAELAAAQAEIAAIRGANAQSEDRHDYGEARTRDLFIDLLLREAGFDPEAPDAIEVEVSGMPNESGVGFVDYVLRGADGKPLGLVEAKRSRKDARVGQQQAKLYADCLERQYGQRPVIFYTNGYDHWIWNDVEAPPRPIQGFLNRDELALLMQRRTMRKPLAAETIDGEIVERAYQHRAIRRVCEAFEQDRQRKALLVMATGAGKTRAVIALCDLLMRANWAKNVLFLADRKALVSQAQKAFKKHLPGSPTVNLCLDKTQSGRVYVSTYPTMMKLIEESGAGERRFGVGHFDLIVIDEAHRSVYRKYKAIFDYFDSYLVGLTATPKGEVDRDTYRLFDLQTGVPTDAYGLDEAVREKYLVPPRAVSLTTDFLERGIAYDQLSDDDKEKWDALEWEEDGGVPAAVEAPALNKWLFNADTVDRVLEHLMREGLKVEDGDRLGKTIIFAKNEPHAKFIADRFDANYPHLAGHFARKIDYSITYAQSLIDDFSIPSKAPHIAISVDMLDTGIDVPEVVNLVFFKPVRSKTKFWQMIGRGTRLCKDLFGPGRDKSFFYIFDWCRNFEFFNENPGAADTAGAAPLSQRLFDARVDLIGEIDGKGPSEGAPAPADPALAELRHGLVEGLYAEVKGMSLENFLVRPKRRYVEKYAASEAWSRLDADVRHELTEHVSGLPTSVVDDDIAAKQFDLTIYRAQIALLRVDAAFAGLKTRIREIASLLEGLGNVPMVAAETALILEVQTDDFWQDVTLAMLETVRRRLRALIKLIEFKKRPIVYSDFEDRLGPVSEMEVRGIPIGTDMEAFRRKARAFLRPYENHIALLKLRRNEALTPTDLEELERIFREAGVEAESVERLRSEGGLGRFVRSLVGLDRAAVQAVFQEFLVGRTLTASQHEFLGLLIDHLTAQGVMDPALLYASPFTDFDALAVEGVFPEADVIRLVDILREVERRAAA